MEKSKESSENCILYNGAKIPKLELAGWRWIPRYGSNWSICKQMAVAALQGKARKVIQEVLRLCNPQH